LTPEEAKRLDEKRNRDKGLVWGCIAALLLIGATTIGVVVVLVLWIMAAPQWPLTLPLVAAILVTSPIAATVGIIVGASIEEALKRLGHRGDHSDLIVLGAGAVTLGWALWLLSWAVEPR
jgi:hypothetical protein